MKENTYIKAGKAIENFANKTKELIEKSRLLRFYIWWQDLIFDIKGIFKRNHY